MLRLFSENAVAFGGYDPTVITGFESYKSKDFEKLHKYFYAVMMHGDNDGVYVNGKWDVNQFAPFLAHLHKKYGKGRAILLVSCWVGWKFAQPLAEKLQLPVVAGLSKVAFGKEFSGKTSKSYLAALDAQGIKLHDELTGQKSKGKPFVAEWLFYHPTGQSEVIPGGKYLNQDEAVQRAKNYVRF